MSKGLLLITAECLVCSALVLALTPPRAALLGCTIFGILWYLAYKVERITQ